LHLRPRPNDAADKTPLAMSLQHWVFKPGTNAHRWTTNQNAENMTLGYQLGVGDVRQYESEMAMKAAADENAGKGRLDILWRFKDVAQLGDLVYAFKGNAVCIGVGVITRGYSYIEDHIFRFRVMARSVFIRARHRGDRSFSREEWIQHFTPGMRAHFYGIIHNAAMDYLDIYTHNGPLQIGSKSS
jgi:hypothetical protein